MIVNIRCLTKACEELAIPYLFLDKNQNFVVVGDEKKYYFSNCSTPLNSEQVATICKDKEFAYDVLKNVIRTPKTKGYFDPFRLDYKKYIEHPSYAAIAQNMLTEFALPFVVKRNAGSQAKNVFICRSETDITAAIEQIFDQDSKEYDFVALAQEYVEAQQELRVITLNKKVVFVYDWSNHFTLIEENAALFNDIQTFIAPLFNKLDLGWSGLDVILDTDGNLNLIEINTKPGFENFVEIRGEERVVEVYKQILDSIF